MRERRSSSPPATRRRPSSARCMRWGLTSTCGAQTWRRLPGSLSSARRGAGQTYLEDGENGLLMLGAATVMWDFLKRCPSLDAVLLPVGGGNLIAGSLLAVQAAGRHPR